MEKDSRLLLTPSSKKELKKMLKRMSNTRDTHKQRSTILKLRNLAVSLLSTKYIIIATAVIVIMPGVW